MDAEAGFSTERYYDAQIEAFEDHLRAGTEQVIEFGGKPFGDYHASRVLPGYDPDIKAAILQQLRATLEPVKLVMAVHAKDILGAPDGRQPAQRIRGDSGLRYDNEVLRLIDQAAGTFGLDIDGVVITAVPSEMSTQNEDYLGDYMQRLAQYVGCVRKLGAISLYPYVPAELVQEVLTASEPLSKPDESVIVLSPGGGSGKFGVCVTEIAHKLQAGRNPNFTKFETFPVFNLPPSHPLNLAFLAATADLPNALVRLENGQTNYDKDQGNLYLMQTLLTHYPATPSPLHTFREPTDMGVNVVERGITDESVVAAACSNEIQRRLGRYQTEHARGEIDELAVARLQEYIGWLMRGDAEPATR